MQHGGTENTETHGGTGLQALRSAALVNIEHLIPGSLAEALEALVQYPTFLLEGDVFTPDVLNTWIKYKQKREVEPINNRPHPWEFYLYHDV